MENSAYLALPLFAVLTAGDIPAALAALDALCRPFAKGETLLEAGQRGAPMGVVLAGRVLIEHLDLWGNRTLLGRAAEGELFAETYAFLPDQPMLGIGCPFPPARPSPAAGQPAVQGGDDRLRPLVG